MASQFDKGIDLDTLVPSAPKCKVINKVFLVVQSSSNKKYMKKVMEDCKTKYELCLNGSIGVRQYETMSGQGEFYRSIFVELKMVGMDGYEAGRQIRALEAKNGYPRSFMFALGEKQDPGIGAVKALCRSGEEVQGKWLRQVLRGADELQGGDM